MSSRLSSFGQAFYDSKRREFIGRDGAGWAKLSVFYAFYYLGLTAFFCAMIGVLMSITPRDQPRYYSESSCMRTRSNPLAPGMGFRPQPDIQKNLVFVNKNVDHHDKDPYVKSLNQYLELTYRKRPANSTPDSISFAIRNPASCTLENNYGFSSGKPCVLVKMNKVVGFKPIPGYQADDRAAYEATGCRTGPNAIAVHCYGENPVDANHIGDITYISENDHDAKCGSLETKWFPYRGKSNRRDVYQAPYLWIRFNNPQSNVLIHVICRVYAENIPFDKKTSRAMTRFKLFVKDVPVQKSSSHNGEI